MLVIRIPHLHHPTTPWSLQLQIALPPLSPAVCPAKSAHDVSLSQLWVEIHRINRFVRETRAWDCLHAVKLVHPPFRPIPPQATEDHCNARDTHESSNITHENMQIGKCENTRGQIKKYVSASALAFAYLSVLYFISRAGQQD